MTTTFTGWRQSTILTPIIDKITTFLALDLNQVQEGTSLPQLSNYTNQDKDRYNIGIDPDKVNPDGPFEYDLLTIELFRDVGVTEDTFIQNPNIIEEIKNQFTAAGITTNSNVTMLLANMLTISNNFSKSVEVWNKIDDPNNRQKAYYVQGNPYGNVGNTVVERREEAYFYRSRGYLPILGHKAYDKFRATLDPFDAAAFTTFLTVDGPISSLFAIMVSLYVWKLKDSGKSPSSYAKGGSSSNFNQTTNAIYNVKDKNAQNNTIRQSFATWAKLLKGLGILGINIDGTK